MLHRALLVLCLLMPGLPAHAIDPIVPNTWDANERLAKPDLADMTRLRFLTTIDFPPFSYLDDAGKISGFHVDLARAICAELDILPRCQIQGLPWGELESAVAGGDGEAIIAGLSPTAETRTRYAFSRAYLRFPARFVMPKATALAEPIYTKLEGKRIGVLAGSAHEAMLRDYFPLVKPVTFSKTEWLYGDLKRGELDAIFGDGMRLSFWLSGEDSAGCCRFAGGPYLAPEFFGPGLAIAVPLKEARLAAAFDYALRAITVKGVFAELYLRHFPVSFY